MDGERVLVVDHSSQRRGNLKRLLQEKRLEVLEASSCEEALALLPNRRASLILTETELPSKSGLYLLKEVKERFSDLEVILITHNASSYNLLQALRHGAYDFIVRPIDSGEILFNALDRAFSHIRLRRQNAGLLRELEQNNRVLLRSLRMMKALNASVERLSAELDIDKLLMALLDSAMEVLQARRGFIALFDRASGELGIKVSQGIDAGLSHRFSERIPPGLTVTMARRGKPVLFPGVLSDKTAALANDLERRALLPGPGLLAAPLSLKDRMAGVILLSGYQGGEPFGEHELHFLIQLSHHASLALEKAGLIHRLRKARTSSGEKGTGKIS